LLVTLGIAEEEECTNKVQESTGEYGVQEVLLATVRSHFAAMIATLSQG
jgi:hypothetical protein